jgi:hypothetical protein
VEQAADAKARAAFATVLKLEPDHAKAREEMALLDDGVI